MDQRQAKIEAFRKQRVARLQAVRAQERQNRLDGARQDNENKMNRQNEMIRYYHYCQLYEYASQQLKYLAYEVAHDGLPNAQDVAQGHVIRSREEVQNRRERLSNAEELCKQLYKQQVESLKRLKSAQEQETREQNQYQQRLREIEYQRSKLMVYKQRVLQQQRYQYLYDEAAFYAGDYAKVRRAQGAVFTNIEKHPQIPVLSQKRTMPGLQIVYEWIPGDSDEVVCQEDAYWAAQNKLAFGLPEKKVGRPFDSQKHLLQDRISSKAQEALNILEQIYKM